MDDKPKTIGQNELSERPQSQVALPLGQSKEGRQHLATRLYRDFHAMKTYGKEPESLKSIVSLFNEVLYDYSFEEIQDAMASWAKRSSEFPTPADIVNIIERDGKPPLSEALFVQKSKIPADLRTHEDWEYMREWEYHVTHGDAKNQTKAQLQEELDRYRKLCSEKDSEIARLKDKLSAMQQKRVQSQRKTLKPEYSASDKIQRTADYMRSQGATEEEINEFIKSQ